MDATHSDDHDRILALARGLKPHLQRRQPPACCDFARLRWTLTREVLAHIAVEDRFVYGGAGIVPDAVRDQARQHLGFSDAFRTFTLRWSGRDVLGDWDAYRGEFSALILRLEARARFEERHGLTRPAPRRAAA